MQHSPSSMAVLAPFIHDVLWREDPGAILSQQSKVSPILKGSYQSRSSEIPSQTPLPNEIYPVDVHGTFFTNLIFLCYLPFWAPPLC